VAEENSKFKFQNSTNDMKRSIFLDLETLDTKPTAIVTEGAFVAFDEETGEILGELEIAPDFWDQLASGRTWSKETLVFHGRLGTLPEGRGGDLDECVMFVRNFFREHAPERVWIWGADFDRPVLEDFMGALPWEFWKTRCARTVWDVAFPGVKHGKRPHRALEDVKASITDLINALAKVERRAAI
jgi:hypothetical protein